MQLSKPMVQVLFKISIFSQFVRKFKSCNGIPRLYNYIFAKFLLFLFYRLRLERITKFDTYLRTLIVHISSNLDRRFLTFKENTLFISFYVCIPNYQPTVVVYANVTDYVFSHRATFCLNRLILHI
jgi:hypothetical protein